MRLAALAGCRPTDARKRFSEARGLLRFRTEEYSLEYLPQDTWSWSEDADTRAGLRAAGINVQPMPPTLAADYLRTVLLPKLRPGAQIVGIEPIPEVTSYIEEQLSGSNSLGVNDAERAGVAAPKNSGDAARARISYVRNGAPVEEWVEIAVEHLQRHAADLAQSLPVGPEGRVYTAPSGPLIDTFKFAECVVLRAPRGRLDEDYRILGSILAHLHQNSSWTDRVSSEYWKGRFNDRIIYFRSSFFGEDRISFQNPSSPNDSLSFAYAYVWSNEKGDEFIVTSSATFDPNGKAGAQTWKPLKPWKEPQQ